MENTEIPKFDPPNKGFYQGHLQLSFLNTMEEIASDEINEIIEKTFPLFLELGFSAQTKFSYLREYSEYILENKVPNALKAKFIKYVDLFTQWAGEYNVDADWFLDLLHSRLGHLAIVETYHKNRLEINNFNPLNLLLSDYEKLKNDEAELFERTPFISEIYEFLNLKNNDLEPKEKLYRIFHFFSDKDEAEITNFELAWKSKKIKEIEAEKPTLTDLAKAFSYNFSFKLELHNIPFDFKFRSWNFNSEHRSNYRKEIKEAFSNFLEMYFQEVERYALEREYKKNALPRKIKGITQNHRMIIFVLYQVKKLSPNDCSREFRKLSKGLEVDYPSVSKIVEDLSKRLGIPLRRSRTKKRN